MKLVKSKFPGGVHPAENKQYSENCLIEPVPAPKEITVLLIQHIGAPCKPCVAKKDKVDAGQVIGTSDAFVSAPVHSPVNGTVKDIALASHPVIGRTQAIYIDTDPDKTTPKLPASAMFDKDFSSDPYTAEQICMAVHNAGLVGMGGAGFPTRVKIEPNPAMPKEMLLINGCECEPFITCDYRIMLEWTWQILAGIRLAAKASGVHSICIAIEDNKPAAIEQMNEAVRLFNWKGLDQVSVLPVETRYPQGGERQLINTVLKKQVPTGGIPPQIGICVLNAATCAAVAEAVVKGAPLTHRTISVTGGAIARPGNYYAPIGMKVQDLIEYAGGLTKSAAKVIMGGPMTGAAVADLSTPIMKTTGSLTLLAVDEVQGAKYRQETPCIRCGRCLSVCPEHINPTKIAHAVKHFRMDIAEQYFMSACIECGCCSYICPANIELTGYIKTGKLLKARAARRVP